MDKALWVWTALFSASALFRLLSLGLWRKEQFRALAIMLATSLARDIALYKIPYTSHAYAVAWEATLPLLLTTHAYAAVSGYRAIAQLYPKIGRFAVRLFVACLVIAALACCGTLPWEITRVGGNQAFIRAMFLLYRGIDGLAAGALILACGFFRHFPKPMKQMPSNLMRHTGLLASYFATSCMLFLVENLAPLGATVVLERLHFALVGIIYATWTFGLSVKGEESEPWEMLPAGVADFMKRRTDTANALSRYASAK